MDEKSKFGGIDMLPENASHADADSGVGIGSVRFEMVGCVYCGVAEVFVEALDMDRLGGEKEEEA
jgi:hypothetical protein